MSESIVNARKAKQQAEEMDDSDFSVGTIEGLDVVVRPVAKEAKTTTKESVAKMTTKTEKQKNVVVSKKVNPEQLEGTVSLKVRKSNKAIIEAILSSSADVIVQEFDTFYELNAEQIKVSRYDAEKALGEMNDGRWRMLFVNREGAVSFFTDSQFTLGVVEVEAEEQKDHAQLNTRILAEIKSEMDTVRALLSMTQAQFLEVAIQEFNEKVKSEML